MGNRLSKYSLTLITFCAIFFASGCGGSDTSTATNGTNPPEIRFVQASPSEGNSNVLVDSVTATTVNYGAATGYLTETSGSHHIQLEPNGSSSAYVDQTLSMSTGAVQTMVVTGLSPDIAGTVFNDSITVATTGDASIRVINAAPAMGPVDVYIVASGTNIANVSPTVANLAFQAATSYQDIAVGTYEIFLTAPGSKSSFTSTGTVTFTANQIRTYVALDALGGGFTQLTLPDAN
ncbi:MAG TPA: DUF4397 domain-containing protein [Terriglobales bacterium]|jgi:hypothetical protein